MRVNHACHDEPADEGQGDCPSEPHSHDSAQPLPPRGHGVLRCCPAIDARASPLASQRASSSCARGVAVGRPDSQQVMHEEVVAHAVAVRATWSPVRSTTSCPCGCRGSPPPLRRWRSGVLVVATRQGYFAVQSASHVAADDSSRSPSTLALPASETPALHDRALQDLSFIRRTMEGAASFTDVPGWGLVGVGGMALLAAPVAAGQPSTERWLAVWVGTAIAAAAVGGMATVRKMRRRVGEEARLQLSAPARKFLLGFWPAVFAGAVLTLALVDPYTRGVDPHIAAHVLPGLWLLLYGVGVTTAGSFSIRAVPLMGLCFVALGTVALLIPFLDGNLMMALGFGALQVGFGLRIARRHGG